MTTVFSAAASGGRLAAAVYALDGVFLRILGMSLAASMVIPAVLLLRLLLRRVPKLFSYVLWAVVLFRLLCPLAIESPFGIVPAVRFDPAGLHDTYERPAIEGDSLSPIYDQAMEELPEGHPGGEDLLLPAEGTPILTGAGASEIGSAAAGTFPVRYSPVLGIISGIWLIGALGLSVYSGLQYVRLRRRLKAAVLLQLLSRSGCPAAGDGHSRKGTSGISVFGSDCIDTAFVAGILRPRIYLPSGLRENERNHILMHELCHICRADPLWRLLAFAALALHWFNPLVWLSFFASRRDMEMSCDEAVMRSGDKDMRAEYSQTLLDSAAGQHRAPLTLLAFGESDTRARVSNVMHWKKPALWTVILAAALCLGAVGVLAMNSENSVSKEPKAESAGAAQPEASAEAYEAEADPNDGLIAWPVDLMGDGNPEFLEVDAAALMRGEIAVPRIVSSDGDELLRLPETCTSHVGWHTVALYEDGARQGILIYDPAIFTGVLQYGYTLITGGPDGSLHTETAGTDAFDLSRSLKAEDIDDIISFVERVNRILDHSSIAFTTDAQVIGRLSSERPAAPGSFIDGAASPVIAVDGEPLYYHEDLSWLRQELKEQGGTAPATEGGIDGLSLRKCLEYRNFLLQIRSDRTDRDEPESADLPAATASPVYDADADSGELKLCWPLEDFGISAGFSAEGDRRHNGIDLAAENGTPIAAAADGTVLYAGFDGSYGNVVRIDHGDGIVTVYAHCSEILVKDGDEVSQGQEIAEVGSSGNATGPHCHFEIGVNGETQDPTGYLPLRIEDY